MNDMKRDIELRLCANLLRDWCRMLAERDGSVEFEDSWCSGSKTIRFCTSAVDGILGNLRREGDCWGLGRFVFYEIEVAVDSLTLSLSVSLQGLKAKEIQRIATIAGSLGTYATEETIALDSWGLLYGDYKGNEALQALERSWETDVAAFERDLVQRISELDHSSSGVPDGQGDSSADSVAGDDLFVEGAEFAVTTDRFERSRMARERCLDACGTACAACGIDFGAVYGSQFARKIDVHHKTPLHEIREDYVVDPAIDLVPLCPNCHRIIHSKPGGGNYTVEEVREMLGHCNLGTP